MRNFYKNWLTIDSSNKLLCCTLIFLFSFVLSMLLVKDSMLVNDEYYKNWPLMGDTASYWIRDMKIAEQALTTNYSSAVLHGALENNRDPLRTFFYIFLNPNKTLSVNGHLYFTGFAALLFFLSLSFCLWKRTCSLVYALGAPISMFLAVGLFSPLYGVPSKLPDVPAALLFGAAFFTLISAKNGRNWQVLFVSGVLLGLATLTRYQVWIYGAFVLGPIVTLYALGDYFQHGRKVRNILFPHLSFLAGVSLIAGWFIVPWLMPTLKFYSIAGYSLNTTVLIALNSTGKKLLFQYFGITLLITFMLLISGYTVTRWSGRKNFDWLDFCIMLWGALSCIILIIFIMRVEDDMTQSYYMVPGIMLFCFAPFCYRNSNHLSPKKFTLFATCFFVLVSMVVIKKFDAFIHSESFRNPPQQIQELFGFNRDLAQLIADNLPSQNLKKLPVLDANFDYYWRFMIPEVQMRFGRLLTEEKIFQIRQSQWKLHSLSNIDDAKAQIMRNLLQKSDLFAALSSMTPFGVQLLKDDFTREMAEYVSHQMAMHPEDWEARGKLTSPYGEVTLYANRHRVR